MLLHSSRSVIRVLMAGFTLAIAAPTASAQHFPSDEEIRSIIQSRVDEDRAVGIVVGVMEANGDTRVVTAGDAGPGARPLSANSVFEIGSITKVFTGILLADMASRGLLGLEDPVQTLLPDGVTVPTRDGDVITLTDLSTHHSALPRLPDNLIPSDPTNPYADYTVEQLYEFISRYELPRDIGAQFEYSNLAVGLLGHVLAEANDSDYEALVRERILDPLGMVMSGIALSDDMEEWLAVGHDEAGNPTSNWDIPTLAGAGALRSNMTDMLRFLDANMGPVGNDLEQAMRTSHAQREALPNGGGVGLNWVIRTEGDDTIVWHNGGTGGYRTFMGFDPELGVGAVVLTNSSHGADDIGFHLINRDVALAPAPEPAPERVEVDVDAATLERYVGAYDLTSTFSIEVTVEDGQLFIQATGQPRFPAFPESETEFFLRVVDAQITFDVGDDGVATGLVLHQGGASQPARKVR